MNRTLECLNRAFAADPNAIHAMVSNHVPCNESLANDPHVIANHKPVLGVGGMHWSVGFLGLLNGVLAENGMPLVEVHWSEPTASGQRTMLGFCEYKLSEPHCAKPYRIVENWSTRVHKFLHCPNGDVKIVEAFEFDDFDTAREHCERYNNAITLSAKAGFAHYSLHILIENGPRATQSTPSNPQPENIDRPKTKVGVWVNTKEGSKHSANLIKTLEVSSPEDAKNFVESLNQFCGVGNERVLRDIGVEVRYHYSASIID